MNFRCTLCGKEFSVVPDDAIPLLHKRHGSTQIYRFPDGTIHNLVSAKAGRHKKEVVTVVEKPKAPEVPAPIPPPTFEENVFLALVQEAAKDEGQRIAAEKAAATQAVSTPHPEIIPPEAAWEPDPDTIYEAQVARVFDGYFFAVLTNEERCYCWMDNIVTPLPNGHCCSLVLATGDVIGLKITRAERGTAQWQATEIHLEIKRAIPEPPERGTVIRWADAQMTGHILRDCGCQLFVNVYPHPQYLKVGDRVEVSEYEISSHGLQARVCEPVWGSTSLNVEDYTED